MCVCVHVNVSVCVCVSVCSQMAWEHTQTQHHQTHLILLLSLDFCRSWCSLMTHSWYSCFWIPVTCFNSLAHLFSNTCPTRMDKFKHWRSLTQRPPQGVQILFQNFCNMFANKLWHCARATLLHSTQTSLLPAVHQSVEQRLHLHPGHSTCFPADASLHPFPCSAWRREKGHWMC